MYLDANALHHTCITNQQYYGHLEIQYVYTTNRYPIHIHTVHIYIHIESIC
jgi:hypothetical protein